MTQNDPRPTLAIALVGVLIGIGASFLPRSRSQFEFPPQVELEKWSLVKTESLPTPPKLAAIAQRYVYRSPSCLSDRQNTTNPSQPCALEIDTYYIYELANSELATMLAEVYGFNLKQLKPSQLPGQGFYVKFEQNQRQYLSSCINPKGEPTVTSKQFLANRNRHDFSLGQFASYGLGLSDLRDKRCLWVVISASQGAQLDLKTAWQAWLNYWQPRFPI
ncbi:MAG: cyanoexosortase A system-associated protein [Pseudanabaenaceae cyanobacterium bins.68]|nr:cyanoexosortase A system-associated protein [Pseudanabaenaceae cyanobacterium bins.68]